MQWLSIKLLQDCKRCCVSYSLAQPAFLFHFALHCRLLRHEALAPRAVISLSLMPLMSIYFNLKISRHHLPTRRQPPNVQDDAPRVLNADVWLYQFENELPIEAIAFTL